MRSMTHQCMLCPIFSKVWHCPHTTEILRQHKNLKTPNLEPCLLNHLIFENAMILMKGCAQIKNLIIQAFYFLEDRS